MKNALLRAGCLLVLSSLLACTPEQTGEDETSNGARFSLPLENFCPAFLNVFEEQQTRCGNGNLDPAFRVELMRFCEDGLLKGVRQGIITYDPALATTCLTSYQQSCNTQNSEAPCSMAFQGTVEPGGECFFEFECADGGCLNDEACPGRCEVLAQPGGSCLVNGCPRGTYCNQGGICATELGVDQACFDGECQPGLECYCGGSLCSVQEEQREGVCKEPPGLGAEGETCSFDRGCREGLFCLSEIGSNDERGRGQCQVMAKPGDPCPVGGLDLNWFFNGCEGSLCGASPDQSRGTCTLSEEGGVCISSGSGFDVPTCDGDFFCDEENYCRLYVEDNTSSEDGFCVRP